MIRYLNTMSEFEIEKNEVHPSDVQLLDIQQTDIQQIDTQPSSQNKPSKFVAASINHFEFLKQIDARSKSGNDITDLYINEINRRNQQDSERRIFYNDNIKTDDRLRGHKFVEYITEQIHSGPINEHGKFLPCPNDYHRGTPIDGSEKYIIIYGEETDKKISDNCNEELFKLINGSEITYGMIRNVNGEKWMNGLIAYNTNSIIIRGNDTHYGQPGFMYVANFYNRLGIKILEEYLIPILIKNINNNEFNSRCDADKIRLFITDSYTKIYNEKIELIKNSKMEELTETCLFNDSLPKETLNRFLDDKDIKIFQLEKRVSFLTERLNRFEEKITELEDMYLDMSIRINKSDEH